MHPFHHYTAGQLDKLLRERHVVVFYDPRRKFEPFVDELRACPDMADVCQISPQETMT